MSEDVIPAVLDTAQHALIFGGGFTREQAQAILWTADPADPLAIPEPRLDLAEALAAAWKDAQGAGPAAAKKGLHLVLYDFAGREARPAPPAPAADDPPATDPPAADSSGDAPPPANSEVQP